MPTTQELRGQWNEVRGAIKNRWGLMTDDELSQAEGNMDQLVGAIQQKTGESRAAIEEFLDSAVKKGSSLLCDAAESVRECASAASENLNEGFNQAQAAVASGMNRAGAAIRKRPAESVAVCFGAGLIAGAVLGLVLRNRS